MMDDEFWEMFHIMAMTVRNHAPDDPTKARTIEWAERELSKTWGQTVVIGCKVEGA